MDHNTAIPGKSETNKSDLVDSYRQMAADQERELEAQEWTESILFDAE